MPKFSIEKIQEIRKSKNLTYDEISEKTGLSKSAISKVFGGFQENPTTLFLEKMAEVLDCGIDDFFVFENTPKSPYYQDRKINEIANIINEKEELKALFYAVSPLQREDVELITALAGRIR